MKLSLAKISFLNVLFTALIFTIVVGLLTVKITNDSYEKRVLELEKNYIEKNKILVKSEVNRTIKRISTLEKVSYDMLRATLEEKVDFVDNIFKNNDLESLTKEGLISKYRSELDLLKWDNNSGYFYIFDSLGKIIYHGINRNLENKYILNVIQNNKELESFIKDTLKKDENFGSYKWPNPNIKDNKLYKKYVYALKLEKYNIYIAAGIYKKELEKKVQHLVFEELENEKFGENKYGYFWIHDLNFVMLMHPTKKELINKNLKNFKTLDGQYFFQNVNQLVLKEKSGFINYKWHRPDNNKVDEKISYVHLIKNWNMVIGSGFYLTELKDILINEKQKLKQSLTNSLQKILVTLLGLAFLSILLAWMISKRIKNVEDSTKDYLNMLEQYKLILDKSVVVSKTNKDGIIIYVNDNFTKISGYSKEEVLGQSHNIVKHPETPKSQFKKLWKTIGRGKIWNGILKNKKRNGDSYFNSTTIVPIKDSDGKIIEYISSGTDVTELFENRTKLKSMFKTDSLTGLGNRVCLIDALSLNSTGVLILINIDRFKEINDIKGHEVGDSILKELSNRLFNFINNEKYVLYRVQADVFALSTVAYEKHIAIAKIEDFMDTIGKKQYIIDNNKFSLTYTSGVASNSENLFSYADMALSEAKNNKVRLKEYDSSMNNIKQYQQNILWVEKLHLALNEDRIVPYFQAIYNYNTQKIEKYECLMRLIEGDKAVTPWEFLSIAKKTKLYPELTHKMITKSINKFATNDYEFSINLSVEDLMNEILITFLYDYAEQKEVFSKMVLEIVESEEIEDSDSISKTIKKFKDRGAKIAIDDFGSGYSNYEYLISLQADYIKIDESIINHILDDERTQEVVRSIVTFAKKSNMKTIAEFVSTKEIDEKVKELGVDYAQGWYYGKAEKNLLAP